MKNALIGFAFGALATWTWYIAGDRSWLLRLHDQQAQRKPSAFTGMSVNDWTNG